MSGPTVHVCAVKQCTNKGIIAVSAKDAVRPNEWLRKYNTTKNIIVCTLHSDIIISNNIYELKENFINNTETNANSTLKNILVIPSRLETYTFIDNEPDESTAGPSNVVTSKPENEQDNDIMEIDFDSIRNLHEHIKKRISTKCKEFREKVSLHIYLQYPRLYEMCHENLNLPSVPELRHAMYKISKVTQGLIHKQNLCRKVINMSNLEKLCVLCLGEIELRSNLYYDIQNDKLLGTTQIFNAQTSDIANYALVLILQGIYSEWKLFISVAFLADKKDINSNEVRQWLKENIRFVLDIGYHMRGFILESPQDEVEVSINKIIAKGNFTMGKHRIVFMSDISSLFKQFYYSLLTQYDGFRLVDKTIARKEHMIDYVVLEAKKKGSDAIPNPKFYNKIKDYKDVSMKQVNQVISQQTVFNMSSYITSGFLHDSARCTLHLIDKMSNLLKELNSDNVNKEYLIEMRVFLGKLSPVTFVNGNVTISLADWINKLISTVNAILTMKEHINDRYKFDRFPTKFLNLDNFRQFVECALKRTTKGNSVLTCKDITRSFKRDMHTNIFKPINTETGIEIEEGLLKIINIIRQNENLFTKEYPPDEIRKHETVKTTGYRQLKLKRGNFIVVTAGYILKACQDVHHYCTTFSRFIKKIDTNGSMAKIIKDENVEDLCLVPYGQIIDFVEMMEIKFRSFMSQKLLTTNGPKLLHNLTAATYMIHFDAPCKCFPVLYARKLFLRLRIYYMIKYNNRLFKRGRNKIVL